MPVKKRGLALLSPCGPSLFLGVEFALDASFSAYRLDAADSLLERTGFELSVPLARRLSMNGRSSSVILRGEFGGRYSPRISPTRRLSKVTIFW